MPPRYTGNTLERALRLSTLPRSIGLVTVFCIFYFDVLSVMLFACLFLPPLGNILVGVCSGNDKERMLSIFLPRLVLLLV